MADLQSHVDVQLALIVREQLGPVEVWHRHHLPAARSQQLPLEQRRAQRPQRIVCEVGGTVHLHACNSST